MLDPFGIGVNSYNRMGVVLENRALMPELEWFAQLGSIWVSCDNIASHRAELRTILRKATRAQLDAMMTPEERDALAAMPETIEVWRGCYRVNKNGLSWTTSREVAVQFPLLNRYRRSGDTPLLLSGSVKRSRAVLKLEREESEIIALGVFAIAREEVLRHV